MESETIQNYRQNILESKVFHSSQTLRDLFDYLVQCSLQKEPPKETTIAIEVFGKKTDFNSNEDPIVRVYVSKLRRKLQEYYNNEGKHDKIRFEIPRGHYEIIFNVERKFSFDKTKVIAALSVLLGLSLIALFYLLFRTLPSTENHPTFYAKHIFWDDFIKSNNPINVVLADQYVYREALSDGEYVLLRNYHVNSDEEFDEFQKRYSEREFTKDTQLPQFDKNSIWGLQYILPVLAAHPHQFFFTLSSDLQTSDLKMNPTIYLGSFVELRFLNSFLQHYGFSFGIMPNYIRIYDPSIDSTETIQFSWDKFGFHDDYTLLAKIPGPNEQPIGIFASLMYSGNFAAAKYMTREKTIIELEDAFIREHGYIPRYFICIFEVDGFKRVDFDLSVRKMIPIEIK